MDHIKLGLVNLSGKLEKAANKRVNLLAALLLIGALSIVGVVASPSETAAGGPYTGCGKGGTITMTKGSTNSLRIAANWSSSTNGHGLAPFMYLSKGQKSCWYTNFGDTDGFQAGGRCSTDAVIVTQDGERVIRVLRHYSAGWNKINSYENVTIRHMCW